MRRGYEWAPANLKQTQNIAFFPAQALLNWLGSLFTKPNNPLPALLMSLSFGAASIFAFHALASRVLATRDAGFAAALFAFWPASSFFIMGYPTGLISLCIIGALGAHVRGQYWRSALWCGLGSAAAPTVMFVVAASYLDRGITLLRQGITARRSLHLALWVLLCASGLLSFMIYQRIRFHDALAFNAAQSAWGKAPGLSQRLHRFEDWHWYIQQAQSERQEIAHGLALWRQDHLLPGMTGIEAGVQRWVSSLSMTLVTVGLAAASFGLWRRAAILPFAGWCVFVGYMWFIFTTSQHLLCVPRLLSPAIALFLGFGLLAGRLPGIVGSAMLLLALLTSALEPPSSQAAIGLSKKPGPALSSQ
ncbi:hypothetical protein SAMN02746095_01640 [Acidocella aminolytica 101 = DSM 11237]|uniref:Uncharacterized protein n=2 Tax=Acidocella TaxID=50709 RepID=A0A0D6PGG9_9PROT|nr:hypothetical protein Aam_041_060 [Acidocella aminolytica 101 = DSM 11237]GBQ44809.1 hypothetical protein AA11237_3591 [Acidocella aminolytica 101 = DSM 11237]SHE93698.1 hypothetical protein SAMN02746095_01640 [Acidocella aminolytica 101 = DSM 11237]